MKKWKIIVVIPIIYLASTIILNFLPEKKELFVPVKDAASTNWDQLSYWFYPWSTSGVHKGIDIFAPHKTPVLSPINGLVTGLGYNNNGGNYIYVLGPKIRLYYFAHLNSTDVKLFEYIKKGQHIGAVGNTGNAISKPYHLHFSICSLVPIFKNYQKNQFEGWKKLFYLNPNNYLNDKLVQANK